MTITPDTTLKALDFSHEIGRLTEHFTAREWLFQQIQDWLSHGDERFCLITGEPGAGKSAVAAQLTQVRSDILAYHFCIGGRTSTIVPDTALRSLAAQLGETLPGYGVALANTIQPEKISLRVEINVTMMTGGQIVGAVINHLHAADVHDVFDMLFRRPLELLPPPPTSHLILLDALDEAVTYGDNNLVGLLTQGAADLPHWLRLLCTVRNEERRVQQHFSNLPTRILTLTKGDPQEDLKRYILNRVGSEAVAERLGQQAASFTTQLLTAADGNFLYATIVLNDVAEGRFTLNDTVSLPQGLDDIYHRFLQRFRDSEWKTGCRLLFGVLAVAQVPLNEQQLEVFTGLSETDLWDYLSLIEQFLDVFQDDEDGTTYRLFHQSFRDYLLNKKRNPYRWCSPKDSHGAIAAHYSEQCEGQWEVCDGYGLRYLPTHLTGAGLLDKLHQLLLDYHWLRSRLAATDLVSLLADYALNPADDALRLVHQVLRRTSHLIVGDAGQLRSQLLAQLPDTAPFHSLRTQIQVDRTSVWLQPLMPSLYYAVPARFYREFPRHDERVTAIVVLPQRGWLLTASDDRTSGISDLERGVRLQTLAGHEHRVKALAVTKDEQYVASAGYDQTIIIWDLDHFTPVARINAEAFVLALAMTDDGYLVSLTNQGKLTLWTVPNGEPVKIVESELLEEAANTVLLQQVELDQASRWCLGAWNYLQASGMSLPAGLTLWRDHGLSTIPRGGSAALLSKAGGREFVRWNLERRTVEGEWSLDGYNNSATLTPDGVRLLYGSVTGELVFWKVEMPNEPESWNGHAAAACTMTITADGRYAITGDIQGAVRMWDLVRAVSTVETESKAARTPWGAAIAGDGQTALSISSTNTVLRWGLGEQLTVSEFPIPTTLKSVQALVPDRKWVVSDRQGQLVVWDVVSGTIQFVLKNLPGRFLAARFSADGHFAVLLGLEHRDDLSPQSRLRLPGVGRENGMPRSTLTLVDVANDHVERSILMDSLPFDWEVRRLAITPDARYAAVLASRSRHVKALYPYEVFVYDLSQGALHYRTGQSALREEEEDPSVALVADPPTVIIGDTAAAVGGPGIARGLHGNVLELTRAGTQVTFHGIRPITDCTLSTDGKRVLAVDSGGYLHFLQLVGEAVS